MVEKITKYQFFPAVATEFHNITENFVVTGGNRGCRFDNQLASTRLSLFHDYPAKEQGANFD